MLKAKERREKLGGSVVKAVVVGVVIDLRIRRLEGEVDCCVCCICNHTDQGRPNLHQPALSLIALYLI